MKNNGVRSDVLVSVVSPIQDAADWIETYLAAISALLASEYKDFEIVLVDNGSTDATVEVIERSQQSLRNIQLYSLARSIPHESAFVGGLE